MLNIAIFGSHRQEYFRRIVEAMLRNVHDRTDIRFRVIEPSVKEMLEYPDLPSLHAAVAPSMSEDELAWFRNRQIPVIYYSSRQADEDLPQGVGRVCMDDPAVGALAADHFDRVGFAHVGFFGTGDTHFAHERERGFREKWFEDPARPRGHYDRCLDGNQAVGQWIKTLPHPMGILCDQDHHAKGFIEEALRLGYRVPQDFAVIGVDHDLMLSELSPVRMTSVEPDAVALAHCVVENIEACVAAGTDPSRIRERISPRGIQYQESAPFHYSTNSEVTMVLNWMESHLAEEVRIDDMARRAGMSRRSLETRFKQTVGMSPYQKILEMRLDLAKRMLQHTNQTMAEIADTCGFTNAREFSVRFKSKVGQPPTAYREGTGEG